MSKSNTTQVARNERCRQNQRKIKRLTCENPQRRAEREADPPLWLVGYFPFAFPLPFGAMHYEIIERFVYAVETGGYAGVVAPRGSGKSTEVNGLSLYAVTVLKTMFPAVIPWSTKDVQKALRFWRNAICMDSEFTRDYPEYCQPFWEGRGVSAKIKTLCWDDTGELTGAELSITNGMIVFPDSLGVIGSATLNGNPRGLNHSTPSGEILRPSLLLIDDPSDKSAARSETQTANIIDMIDSDVLGMAGPGNKISALMTATVLANGDTASHYMADDEWQFVVAKQIVTWPDGWDDKDSLSRTLWDEWNSIRIEGNEQNDRGEAARAFYHEHKEAMIPGMTVSWEHRYDAKRLQPDAMYAAMEDFYRMGKAFFSERQNAPVVEDASLYDLSPAIVANHVNGLPHGQVDRDYGLVMAGTDINHYGLHWVIAGFANDISAQVCAYGNYPGKGQLITPVNSTDVQIDRAIYNCLSEVAQRLEDSIIMRGGIRVRIDGWVIDGGYRHESVQRFARNYRGPLAILVARGTDSTKYTVTQRTLVGKPKEFCHLVQARHRYASFDQHHWLEVAQRAWMDAVGSPGGISLYGNDPMQHEAFAAQVCAEKIADKVKSKDGYMYKVVQKPGVWHDYGDAVYLAYVGAAISGLTTTGERRQTSRKPANKQRPKSTLKI